MCGIVGLINHKINGLWQAEENIFKRLLYIDKERGEDSTGVFTVLNNGLCILAKEASTPEVFDEHEQVKDLYKKAFMSGTCLVGHNRKATRGDVTDENAHPFSVGDVVLIHNGSLTNHKALADTAVDSEAIAVALNGNLSVEEVFNKVNGAFSCVWYDNRNKTLNFLRNSERPMWIYEDKNTTYFGSEAMMLYYALSRGSVKWEKDNCRELPVYTHLQYEIHKSGGMSKVGETKLEIKKPFTDGTATAPNTKPVGTTNGATSTKISLSERKRMRNEANKFLSQYPANGQTVCTFEADDWEQVGNQMLLLGSLVAGPKFLTVVVPMPIEYDENAVDNLLDACDMQFNVKLLNADIDHKKQVFQINAEMVE